MKIKEEKWDSCGKCGQRTKVTQQEEYGCDKCRKAIKQTGDSYLRMTVFSHKDNKDARHYEFCSWECCLAFLRTVKTDYFVSLPYLTYDSKKKGIRASDFLKLIKPIKRS